MEQRARVVVVPGGLQQLLLRCDFQPRRCIYLGGGGLSAGVPLAILPGGVVLERVAEVCGANRPPAKKNWPKVLRNKKKCYLCATKRCPDGEMVDTLVSGASASRHVGSSPILGTVLERVEKLSPFSFFSPRNSLVC